MMIRGYEIAGRTIALIIGVLVLIVAVSLTVRSCDKRRAEHAQNKVDQAQGDAFQNSATDAVTTQGEANKREADSEAMTRSNERTIRDAEGSTDAVNPAVRDAGFASLCKRPSFRNSPTGRLRCPPAARVEKGR